MDDIAKRKISESLKCHVVTDDTKLKIGKSNTGKKHPHTDEAKNKISRGMASKNKGKVHSDEFKKKLSDYQTGRKRGPYKKRIIN